MQINGQGKRKYTDWTAQICELRVLLEASLGVLRLGLCLPVQRVPGPALVGELHARKPPGQKPNQIINQKQFCNKFPKDFKNGPH